MISTLSVCLSTCRNSARGDDGDRRQLRDQRGDRYHAREVPDPMNLLGEQQHFIYPTVEAYAHAVEAARPSLNVGTLIGHTALRNNHMDDLFRPASETEIAGMRVQLRDALRQGALGSVPGWPMPAPSSRLPKR